MAFGYGVFKRTSIPLLLVLFAVALVFIYTSRQTKEKESFENNSAGGYVLLVLVMGLMMIGAFGIPYMISQMDK